MNTTIKDEIRAENVHHSNEINARNLEQYHQMLNSFNMQATLIVGFALNSINHDNLNALASDESKYCLYTSSRKFFGYLFGSATVACISISLTCILASFYITIRSQQYALHVGVKEAVAMVRMWARTIIAIYSVGLLCFFLAALSLICAPLQPARVPLLFPRPSHARMSPCFSSGIFTGGNNWTEVSDADAASSSADGAAELPPNMVRLDSGKLRQTCLNPTLSESHDRQLAASRLFAILTTATFAGSVLFGGCFLWYLQRDFRIVEDQIIRLHGKARLELLAMQQQKPGDAPYPSAVPQDFTTNALAECRELEA